VWPCLDGRILAYTANSASTARESVAQIAAVIEAEDRVYLARGGQWRHAPRPKMLCQPGKCKPWGVKCKYCAGSCDLGRRGRESTRNSRDYPRRRIECGERGHHVRRIFCASLAAASLFTMPAAPVGAADRTARTVRE